MSGHTTIHQNSAINYLDGNESGKCANCQTHTHGQGEKVVLPVFYLLLWTIFHLKCWASCYTLVNVGYWNKSSKEIVNQNLQFFSSSIICFAFVMGNKTLHIKRSVKNFNYINMIPTVNKVHARPSLREVFRFRFTTGKFQSFSANNLFWCSETWSAVE